MFFGFTVFELFKKIKKKDKEGDIPAPITLEQAKEIIKKNLVSPEYADYATNGWVQNKVYVVGKTQKQRILLVQLEQTPYSSVPYQFCLLNLHYPTELYSYIEQEKYNPAELLRQINVMTTDPTEMPDIEKTEIWNPITQSHVKTEKTTKRKEDKTKEKKKEDLL